ncbi:hypothetical protein EIP91_004232, partial [Steccherinum ochraceum]
MSTNPTTPATTTSDPIPNTTPTPTPSHTDPNANPTQTYIRRATPSDSPALSRICLLTGDAGQSAAPLHTFGELPGVMYAEPYVHMPSAGGFVLVDPSL